MAARDFDGSSPNPYDIERALAARAAVDEDVMTKKTTRSVAKALEREAKAQDREVNKVEDWMKTNALVVAKRFYAYICRQRWLPIERHTLEIMLDQFFTRAVFPFGRKEFGFRHVLYALSFNLGILKVVQKESILWTIPEGDWNPPKTEAEFVPTFPHHHSEEEDQVLRPIWRIKKESAVLYRPLPPRMDISGFTPQQWGAGSTDVFRPPTEQQMAAAHRPVHQFRVAAGDDDYTGEFEPGQDRNPRTKKTKASEVERRRSSEFERRNSDNSHASGGGAARGRQPAFKGYAKAATPDRSADVNGIAMDWARDFYRMVFTEADMYQEMPNNREDLETLFTTWMESVLSEDEEHANFSQVLFAMCWGNLGKDGKNLIRVRGGSTIQEI
jgi:hypothetical protein